MVFSKTQKLYASERIPLAQPLNIKTEKINNMSGNMI